MRLIQKLTNSLFFRTKVLLGIVSLFAVFGTLLELSSGIWDATSHVLEEPEFFWSIQHIAVYCGVAMIVTSGIFGFILMFKKKINGTLKKGIKIIIIHMLSLIS